MEKIKVLNEDIQNFRDGDDVWWLDRVGNVIKGTIRGNGRTAQAVFHYPGGAMVTLSGSELKECWPTRRDCHIAEASRCRQQAKAYGNSITDVESLVRFLWEKAKDGSLDDDAEEAARRRARALLGIELD